GAARDDADWPFGLADAVAADRRLIPAHEDAGEVPAYLADIRPASDDFLADIAAFGEAQCGVRRHFKCEGPLVHFGPVPRDSRLDSQDLVGIPSDRSRAGSQERLPNFRETAILGPHLKSRRPVRSASYDPALSTVGHRDTGEAVEGEPAHFRSHDFGADVRRVRAFD